MKIITIANNKGGVSKTTSTFNLAYALAHFNKKVLMYDNDPQSSLTIYMGLNPLDLTLTAYDIISGKCNTKDAILTTDNKNIDIIPSSIELSAGEIQIISTMGREFILRNQLETIKDEYDYILIDNTPSLGILTINSMMASDYIIAPLEPSFLGLKGMSILASTIDQVKTMNTKLELMGVLITMFNSRTIHHQEVVSEIQSKYPIFKSFIKRSIKFSDSCLACRSIIDYAGEDFDGSQAYINLAKEVIEYVK
jgi:chromosome partitioning protein